MTSNSSDHAITSEAPLVPANDELHPDSGIVPSAPDWAGQGLAPARQALGAFQFPKGRVVAGKYRIERKVGEGAMGVVVAATHLGLDETVAIKFILPDAKSNPEVLSRFAKEAKISAKIKSEHITKVLDVGVSKPFGPYIVMEYLDGESLAEVLEKRGKLSVDKAVEYVLQACEALAAAHSTGVIHRDIKPGNLFVTRHGSLDTLKLLDFGISKAALTGCVFGNDLSLTATTHVVGTPMYMSPEQVRSNPGVDSRTDLWSLGAVLFELLTGRTAFVAESLTEICANILEGAKPQVPISFGRQRAPLQAIIDRCLERDVAKRYQTVVDLAAALMPLASNSAQQYADRSSCILRASSLNVVGTPMPPAVRALPEPSPASGVQVTSLESSQPHWTAEERRQRLARNVLIAAVGLVAILAAGIGFFPRAPVTVNEGPVSPASLHATLSPRDHATTARAVSRREEAGATETHPAPRQPTAPPNALPSAERTEAGRSGRQSVRAKPPVHPNDSGPKQAATRSPRPPRVVATASRPAALIGSNTATVKPRKAVSARVTPRQSLTARQPPPVAAASAKAAPVPTRPRLVDLRSVAKSAPRPALVSLPSPGPITTP